MIPIPIGKIGKDGLCLQPQTLSLSGARLKCHARFVDDVCRALEVSDLSKNGGKMSTKVRRCLITIVVFSLLIQAQFAVNGYAALKAQIAFTSTRDGNSEIYVMDIDGDHQVRLTIDPARDSDPSWSPDGARIAFVSNRDRGLDRIYVMDSDGQHVTRLTMDSTNLAPAWSPDAAKIAFTRLKGGIHI